MDRKKPFRLRTLVHIQLRRCKDRTKLVQLRMMVLHQLLRCKDHTMLVQHRTMVLHRKMELLHSLPSRIRKKERRRNRPFPIHRMGQIPKCHSKCSHIRIRFHPTYDSVDRSRSFGLKG
jgi:hypothetical protein